MKEKESNKGYYTLIILGSALLLLSAAYLLLQFVRGYDWCQSEFFGANGSAGNIGDFFSGTIGVLLSFISTVLVIYTIWQQNKQFKLAQEEQRQGRFEIAYYNLVGMIDKTRQTSENTLAVCGKPQQVALQYKTSPLWSVLQENFRRRRE